MRDQIQAECDRSLPNDPVGAAKLAHEKRLEVAATLRREGKYSPEQYSEFRSASLAEMERTIKARGYAPWDWRRIADFRSRTLRSEFIVAWAIAVVTVVIGAVIDGALLEGPGPFLAVALGVSVWLYIGASVNRLHDLGYSGWIVVLGVVPVAGIVVLAVLSFQKGQARPNKWGPPVRGTPPRSASSSNRIRQ